MRSGSPDPRLNRPIRATSNVRDACGSYPSIRHTLAVVPPMSKLSTCSNPQARAMLAAKMAPPAGPLSTSRIGNRQAVSSPVNPPPDSIRNSGARSPVPRSPASSRRRYPAINGCTYALAAVVLNRSHSRISGLTSHESDTGNSGSNSARISRTRRSCAGLVKLCRKPTATLSTPSRRSTGTRARTAASANGSSTRPSLSSRSGTVSRR